MKFWVFKEEKKLEIIKKILVFMLRIDKGAGWLAAVENVGVWSIYS